MEPHNNGHSGNGRVDPGIAAQLAALARLRLVQLQAEYARVFGEVTSAHNRVWLLRRIAWRIQALAEGDLSERARQRAVELANDANLRLGPPTTRTERQPRTGSPAAIAGSPANRVTLTVGTLVTRIYKGAKLEVKVLDQGFQYQGTVYRSLSAVAKTITGGHCSGRAFFGIHRKGGDT